jgi:uncharacterized protein YbjT (DUF2867 family)
MRIGQEALDHNQVAAAISKVSGKPITYPAIPEEGTRTQSFANAESRRLIEEFLSRTLKSPK